MTSLILMAFLLPPAFLIWKGGWWAFANLADLPELRRLLAGVPVALYLLWSLSLVVMTARDPTDRNLWPLELILGLILWAVYLVVLRIGSWAVRAFARRGG